MADKKTNNSTGSPLSFLGSPTPTGKADNTESATAGKAGVTTTRPSAYDSSKSAFTDYTRKKLKDTPLETRSTPLATSVNPTPITTRTTPMATSPTMRSPIAAGPAPRKYAPPPSPAERHPPKLRPAAKPVSASQNFSADSGGGGGLFRKAAPVAPAAKMTTDNLVSGPRKLSATSMPRGLTDKNFQIDDKHASAIPPNFSKSRRKSARHYPGPK